MVVEMLFFIEFNATRMFQLCMFYLGYCERAWNHFESCKKKLLTVGLFWLQ